MTSDKLLDHYSLTAQLVIVSQVRAETGAKAIECAQGPHENIMSTSARTTA